LPRAAIRGRDPVRAAVLVAAVACLPAMRQQPQPPANFHAETRLVVLRATVKNEQGADVAGLDASAFRVYEDGKRQTITLFRRDDVPVSLGLLIDNSGSMRTLRRRVEAAALAFVHDSNPLDEAFVLNFADTPRIDVEITRDAAALEAGIARVDSIGGTALRDAVDLAERYLGSHAARDRKVLLLVTDGRDNASRVTMREIEHAADVTDIAVYAIGVFADPSDTTARAGRHELDELTRHTGGVAYYPATLDEVDTVVRALARQIRNQYTIAYASTNQVPDGTYRRVRLEARGSGRLIVRTREGYIAGPTRDD